jgi:tetratricopeptide (TPR) repeat protein
MRAENPALEALAAEQCAAHRCESAISLLEAAFVQQPCNAELSHQIGFCYSGACRRHGQVSLPLAIAYFERAFDLVRIGGPAAVRARYLDSLGNARLADREPSAAVSPLEEAAQIYQDLGLQEEWARTEYNLGNASCELAEVGVPSMWEKAVRHYSSALRVRTEEADPVRFAATAQNLGTAYRELPGGDRVANLREAIGWYCAAFRVYAGEHMPGKCADLHNNLGNAYLSLPDPPAAPCKYVRRALRHYALALQVRTKTDRPHDYAVTQSNCGQGYLLLAACDFSGNVQPAVACFREALDGFLRCGDTAGAEIVKGRLEALKLLSSAAA